MNAARQINAIFLRPLHLGHLSISHSRIGQPEVALGLLDEAIQLARETGEYFFAAELYRLRGEALLELDNEREGEVDIQRALSVAREQEAGLWELRVATSFARRGATCASLLKRAICSRMAGSPRGSTPPI
jgi:predicted ATPase